MRWRRRIRRRRVRLGCRFRVVFRRRRDNRRNCRGRRRRRRTGSIRIRRIVSLSCRFWRIRFRCMVRHWGCRFWGICRNCIRRARRKWFRVGKLRRRNWRSRTPPVRERVRIRRTGARRVLSRGRTDSARGCCGYFRYLALFYCPEL